MYTRQINLHEKNDTHHLYELWQLQPQPHSKGFGIIIDRSNEPVVIGQQVIVEPFGIGIGFKSLHHGFS